MDAVTDPVPGVPESVSLGGAAGRVPDARLDASTLIDQLPRAIESAVKTGREADHRGASTADISSLQEKGKDPVLNTTIEELIFQNSKFIVYLDSDLRVQYRGEWNFPRGSDEICFELARLESLTLDGHSIFGLKRDRGQLLAMRRLIGEVFAKLHEAPDVEIPRACLARADQVITGIITDNCRFKSVVVASAVTAIVGLIGWVWIARHNGSPGINVENEFGLWIPLGAIGALLFSFTRMNTQEVKLFSSNWLIFVQSTARILAGGIGALVLVAAAKANFLLGVLSQSTSSASAFWGLVTLAILAGASERMVPDFISRMDGNSAAPNSPSAKPTK